MTPGLPGVPDLDPAAMRAPSGSTSRVQSIVNNVGSKL